MSNSINSLHLTKTAGIADLSDMPKAEIVKSQNLQAENNLNTFSVSSQMGMALGRLNKMIQCNPNHDNTVKSYDNKLMDIAQFEKQFGELEKGSQDALQAYTLVKLKMEEVNISMKELDAKNIKDLVGNEKKQKTFDSSVKYNIQAQYKLKEAFTLLQKATGVDFTTQKNLCDRRIASTMNLVGAMMNKEMQDKIIPKNIGEKAFSEHVSDVSLDNVRIGMRNFADGIIATIDKVNAKIDSITIATHTLSDEAFEETMQTINNNIEVLSNKIDDLKRENENFDFENSGLNMMKTSLTHAKERLNNLATINKDQGIDQLISSFDDYYLKSSDKFMGFVKTLPAGNPIRFYMVKAFEAAQDVSKALHAKSENPAELVNAAYKFCNTGSRTYEQIVLSAIRYAKEPDDKVFQDNMNKLKDSRDDDAKNFISSLIIPMRNYEKEHPGTIAKVSFMYNPTVFKEVAKLSAAFEQNHENIYKTGEIIDNVFNYSGNIPAMLEVRMRGLPLRNAMLNLNEANFVAEKKLGQGAANEVFLCTYKQNGVDEKYVFKGEYDARKGITGLQLGNLGYHDDIYINSLNVACTEVSELIGCQSAIAQSKVGMHKNQFGLFMSLAEGKTVHSLLSGEHPAPVANIKGKDVTLSRLGSSLDDEQQKIFIASLAKELTKLEWSDTLTAQLDRHRDNYLFAFDPMTCEAKITGIDNDACFSASMVGVGKLQVDDVMYDYSMKYSSEDIRKLKVNSGINQMFRPMFITQETYDKLQNINENDYKQLLSDRIGASEVDAAMYRLIDAKEYAKHLQNTGRCFNDHEWNSPKLFKALDTIMKQQDEHFPMFDYRYFRRNFITRDFNSLAGTIEKLAKLNK